LVLCALLEAKAEICLTREEEDARHILLAIVFGIILSIRAAVDETDAAAFVKSKILLARVKGDNNVIGACWCARWPLKPVPSWCRGVALLGFHILDSISVDIHKVDTISTVNRLLGTELECENKKTTMTK